MSQSDKINVLLVGAGKMGLAMLKGWLADKDAGKFSFTVADPHPSKDVKSLESQGRIELFDDPTKIFVAEAVAESPVHFEAIVLAVKPQNLFEVTDGFKEDVQGLCVSIVAGITAAALQNQFEFASIVRAMPNLPAQIGAGICGGYALTRLSDTDKQICEFLLGSTGKFEWVDEEAQIDAVTAISGSGPAYVFLLAEALTNVAYKIGLDARNVETFANQTIIGAAELLKQSEDGAATLRRNVTSPGGTTEAALKVLMREGNGLEELLLEAVEAAKKRSEELSK